jgi:DNA ligase-1
VNTFAELFRKLDATTKTGEKSAAIVEFFQKSSRDDSAWAVSLLMGNRIRPPVKTKLLREWTVQQAGISDWLFEECYAWVGDLAETLNTLIPEQAAIAEQSLSCWIAELDALRTMTELEKRNRLDAWLPGVAREDRFVLLKLFTGTFRVGVNKGLVIRAISEFSSLPKAAVADRLAGDWKPSPEAFDRLISTDWRQDSDSQPYPFALAHPWEETSNTSVPLADYLIEWKWDGIRAQLIRRKGNATFWSRGEERLDGRFPELESSANAWSDSFVLDGEILAWKEENPLPFTELQKRIQRKTLTKKLIQQVPVQYIAFDILEYQGRDLRGCPLGERRTLLESLFYKRDSSDTSAIRCSHATTAKDWNEIRTLKDSATQRGAEGVMLKRLDASYPSGRTRGPWWKWKVDPFTIDAVLLYAQRGHGRRASLYTDYTFGLWDHGVLVPFAKAYSGLTDQEIREVDQWIRMHVKESFGPVRSVLPELVMEIAFENVQLSTRHKCGLAVRFPRIVRWRKDKAPDDANRLQDLQSMVRRS